MLLHAREAHSRAVVQALNNGNGPAEPDCAIDALGATTEAIKGKAIIEVKPTFFITSRRLKLLNSISTFSLSSSKLRLFKLSRASQINSSGTLVFSVLLIVSLMSVTEFSPLHIVQTYAEVSLRQKA